jgi:hypothetical protein
MELKGRFGASPVYRRSRIIDLMTWHGDLTHLLFFEHQTQCMQVVMEKLAYIHELYNWRVMYMDKMCIFSSIVNKKWEMSSAEGNGRPSKKDVWSVEKYVITYAP